MQLNPVFLCFLWSIIKICSGSYLLKYYYIIWNCFENISYHSPLGVVFVIRPCFYYLQYVSVRSYVFFYFWEKYNGSWVRTTFINQYYSFFIQLHYYRKQRNSFITLSIVKTYHHHECDISWRSRKTSLFHWINLVQNLENYSQIWILDPKNYSVEFRTQN